MSRHLPDKKPKEGQEIIFKYQWHVLLGRYFTKCDHEHILIKGIDQPPKSLSLKEIECWWPMPTEEQLDVMNDYAVVGHRGETRGSMGPFLVGQCSEDYESGCLVLDDEVLEDGLIIPDYEDPMNWEIGPGAENG